VQNCFSEWRIRGTNWKRTINADQAAVSYEKPRRGLAAAMRDLELVNVLSLIHLGKACKMPLYLGGAWNGHIGNDHGGDDIHIGPYFSSTPTIPKGFVFAHTLEDEDLYLDDSFHSLVRRGTWRHNNGNRFENDVRAHRTVSKVKCSHVHSPTMW